MQSISFVTHFFSRTSKRNELHRKNTALISSKRLKRNELHRKNTALISSKRLKRNELQREKTALISSVTLVAIIYCVLDVTGGFGYMVSFSKYLDD